MSSMHSSFFGCRGVRTISESAQLPHPQSSAMARCMMKLFVSTMAKQVFVLAVGFGLVAVTHAVDSVAPRTWTDIRGNQIRGTYHGSRDNTVRIKSSDRYRRIPFRNLSVSDQVYVHFRRLGQNERERLRREIVVGEPRTWTTVSGVRVTGRFYRFVQNHLAVFMNDDFQAIRFSDLIPNDQRYVRERFKELGLASPPGERNGSYLGFPAIRPVVPPDPLQEPSHTDSVSRKVPDSNHTEAAFQEEGHNHVIDEQEFFDRFMPDRQPIVSGQQQPDLTELSSEHHKDRQQQSDRPEVSREPGRSSVKDEMLPTIDKVQDDFLGYVNKHGGLVLFLLVLGVAVIVLVKIAIK